MLSSPAPPWSWDYANPALLGLVPTLLLILQPTAIWLVSSYFFLVIVLNGQPRWDNSPPPLSFRDYACITVSALFLCSLFFLTWFRHLCVHTSLSHGQSVILPPTVSMYVQKSSGPACSPLRVPCTLSYSYVLSAFSTWAWPAELSFRRSTQSGRCIDGLIAEEEGKFIPQSKLSRGQGYCKCLWSAVWRAWACNCPISTCPVGVRGRSCHCGSVITRGHFHPVPNGVVSLFSF